LGIRSHVIVDAGAYSAIPFSPAMFVGMIRVMLPGPYRVPAMEFKSQVVASNKGTYVAYRGPWAMETYVRERMFDIAARNLGISRVEIRRRNMIGVDELPMNMLTGPKLDVRMSAKRTFEEAMTLASVETWEQTKLAARAQGKTLGMGFATFIEAAPGPPDYFDHVMPGMGSMLGAEPAYVTLDADGTVSVFTQQVPHGQGHETTLAQVAADQLGVPMESVRVKYGNTAITPFGLIGTGGSRSAPMAGGAVTFGARELRNRIAEIAADLLEAATEDIVIEQGRVHVAGVPSRSIGLDAVATEAIRRGVGPEAGTGEAIRVIQSFDGGEGGWAQSTHVCWVELDLETGRVSIPRYLVVEDCGELINPAIVEGQVRGGVAQGIGQVLYEKTTYDENGQFKTGTFMDYLIPTCAEIPEIEIHHLETPSTIEANYRGVGEGGMIAAPAALTNAIEDALSHLGITITDMYLPPSRILELAGVIEPDV
jgi:aerobic carbon-monoxide dehydrogenase large subunit